MKNREILVSTNDILIRPHFLPDGNLEGYYALPATEFADENLEPSDGEIRETPGQALEVFLEERKGPPHAAVAFARNWISRRSPRYDSNSKENFKALQKAIENADRVDISTTDSEDLADQCERELIRCEWVPPLQKIRASVELEEMAMEQGFITNLPE